MTVEPTNTEDDVLVRSATDGPTRRGAASLAAAIAVLTPFSRRAGVFAVGRAVHWLIPGGLVVGLIYVALYRSSWLIFGDVGGVRIMPGLAVWLLDVVFFGMLPLLGAVRCVEGWRSGEGKLDPINRTPELAGMMALAILLALKLGLWVSLPNEAAYWHGDWRRIFNPFLPRPLYRPLILAPLWGRWGLMLAAGIGRTAASGRGLAGVSGFASPGAILGWFGLNLVLTAAYCSGQGKWMIGCMISLAVMGVAYFFSAAAARRFSGQREVTIYATAMVAELAFLIGYLALSQHIY